MATVERMTFVVVTALLNSAAHGSINSPHPAEGLEDKQYPCFIHTAAVLTPAASIFSVDRQSPVHPCSLPRSAAASPSTVLAQSEGTACQTPEGSCDLSAPMPIHSDCICPEFGGNGYVSATVSLEPQGDSKPDTTENPNPDSDEIRSDSNPEHQDEPEENNSNPTSVSEEGNSSGNDQ